MAYPTGTDNDGRPFITCNICGRTSYHPGDVENKYCVKCNKFLDPDDAIFYLLPCAPDVCQECAVDHEPWQAHNQQSLYYQYHFYAKHGRWPTWEDAIAHCAPDIQDYWRKYLKVHGVEI